MIASRPFFAVIAQYIVQRTKKKKGHPLPDAPFLIGSR
jgi:hypothetical protein